MYEPPPIDPIHRRRLVNWYAMRSTARVVFVVAKHTSYTIEGETMHACVGLCGYCTSLHMYNALFFALVKAKFSAKSMLGRDTG